MYSKSSSLEFFENTKILKAYLFVSIQYFMELRRARPTNYRYNIDAGVLVGGSVYTHNTNEVIRSALNELNPMVNPQNHSGDVW